MLQFKEITLEDRELFNSCLGKSSVTTSELTFTNLFMWRNFYNIRYTRINGMLCLVSIPDESKPFAFKPIGEYNQEAFSEAAAKLSEYFSSNGWSLCFKRVAESELELFKKCMDVQEVLPDRNNSDYLYLTEDLVYLKGKKYDGKRNHINKFKKLYECEYVPLEEQHLEECCRITEEWCSERSCDEHKGLYCEKLANFELIKNLRALGCKGALIKVNGRFEAFTIGEMLNPDTAVIHIEKANGSINGLYTYINQQFCLNQWHGAKYINREQDLGSEGLRKAKLSYKPIKFIDKYSICVK